MMYVGKNLKRKEHPLHHSKQRVERGNKLVKSLTKHKGIEKSYAFSSIKWDEISEVYLPIISFYTQELKPIDIDHINFLKRYYQYSYKAFSKDTYESELRVNILISPVFMVLTSLYPDLVLHTEHQLKGRHVNAHGKFEFIIKRGNKSIFVIESKQMDVQQGRAQALVGCEIAAEIEQLDVVYGIVTTFYQWDFYKCLNDGIQKDEVILVQKEKFVENALEEITGKINALLSD